VEILAESRRRLNYAKKILREGEVLEVLEKYGEVLVVGSLAMELYWRRDIDIVVETRNLRCGSIGALNEFIEGRRFSKYQYGDFMDYPREGRPKGYIVNLFHRGTDGELWEFEIWFLEDISHYEKQLKEWRSALNEGVRGRIIEMKANGGLKQESSKIYDEILKKGRKR